MLAAAFASVALPHGARGCRKWRGGAVCAQCSPPAPVGGTPATGVSARRLATWLAADWANKKQAMQNPQFWAHIHVCFRPLPWAFLHAYSFYCESAYDYNLGAPYKTSVVRIENDGKRQLQLASYRVRDAQQFWLGAHEPQLLHALSADMLLRLPDACNTLFEWQPQQRRFMGSSLPGRQCRIRRGGSERETYLDSKLMLTEHCYSAWDVGRDPLTHERVWGPAAGPFVFEAVSSLHHLVPQEAHAQ